MVDDCKQTILGKLCKLEQIKICAGVQTVKFNHESDMIFNIIFVRIVREPHPHGADPSCSRNAQCTSSRGCKCRSALTSNQSIALSLSKAHSTTKYTSIYTTI
jgi:hypothetical protein